MPEGRVDLRSRGRGGLADYPYALLSLASLFWAGNTVLGRFIVGHIPPMTFACLRWAGAFLIVAPFALPHIARDWPTIRRHAGWMTVLALTGISAYNALTYYGLQYTTAINASLLLSAGPLFVGLCTFVLFGDRLTWRQAVGVAVSLTGVTVIICHGSLALLTGIGFNRGDVLFLIAVAISGYYTAALRKRPPMHPLSFLAVVMGLGALLLVPAAGWEIASGKTVALDAVNLASVAYVCVFPSVLGYLCFIRGVELIGANRAAPFIHLVPVFSSVMAIVLLGERFELFHAAGYALVFTGITVATKK
jgi:drug/metabolite transporter (DMT)-like permease